MLLFRGAAGQRKMEIKNVRRKKMKRTVRGKLKGSVGVKLCRLDPNLQRPTESRTNQTSFSRRRSRAGSSRQVRTVASVSML